MTMLKSVFFLTIMSALVCSCTNADQKKEQPTETNPSASTPPSSYSMKKVEKEVMVKEDFFQITNLSSGIIEFNQGPNKIWAEGDSASLSHLSFEFDGGILTVSTPMEANNDVVGFPSSSDIRIHVSCPDLRAMAVCSGGGFVCKETLKSDQLQLGGLVGGKIEIDSIACRSFRYDSNGSTALNIGGVSCDEAVFISTGSGEINTNLTAHTNTYIDIKGTSSMNCTITTPKLEGFIETRGSANLNIDTDTLSLDALAGTVNLSGRAGKQEIRKGKMLQLNSSL